MSESAVPAQPKPDKRVALLIRLRRAINGPLLWLGLFVGAVSGVSAIARLFHVGLFGVFHDFVQFYRALLRPIYDLVNWPPWPFNVPELAVDLFAVYVVLVGTALRSRRPLVAWTAPGGRPILFVAKGVVRTTQLWEILRCLLLIPILLLAPLRDYLFDEETSRIRKTLKRRRSLKPSFEDHWEMSIINSLRINIVAFLAVPAAILVFFMLNAYAPVPHP